MPLMECGGGGAYSFVTCLSPLTINHASLLSLVALHIVEGQGGIDALLLLLLLWSTRWLFCYGNKLPAFHIERPQAGGAGQQTMLINSISTSLCFSCLSDALSLCYLCATVIISICMP